jgi:hypothetical protein
VIHLRDWHAVIYFPVTLILSIPYLLSTIRLRRQAKDGKEPAEQVNTT